MSRANERIVVVTGASRGIGRACAIELAKQGAHVVAIARTVGALEELDDDIRRAGGAATLVPLDLKDFDGIDRLGAALFERFGRIDALLANAAVLGVVTPVAHLKPKDWDETLAINVTANYRMIRSFDPLLRASGAGRAVFMTTGAARGHIPYWMAYSTTKAAMESMVLIYAAEVKDTNLRVNLFTPGAVRTLMRAKAFPGEDPMTLPPPEEIAPQIVALLSPECTRHGELVSVAK